MNYTVMAGASGAAAVWTRAPACDIARPATTARVGLVGMTLATALLLLAVGAAALLAVATG